MYLLYDVCLFRVRMAADMGLFELASIIASEEAAIDFSRRDGPLPRSSGRQEVVPCRKRDCRGKLRDANVRSRGRTYPVVRCSLCRAYWSARASPAVLAEAGQAGQQEGDSFLASQDCLGRPCTKLPIRVILALLWTWALDLTIKQCQRAMVGGLSAFRRETFVDWRHFC